MYDHEIIAFLEKHAAITPIIAFHFMRHNREETQKFMTAMGEKSCYVPTTASAASSAYEHEDRILICVPENVEKGWGKASYLLSRSKIREWVQIYNNISKQQHCGKVEAIKQCRAYTGLGLKECRDLMQYIILSGTW